MRNPTDFRFSRIDHAAVEVAGPVFGSRNRRQADAVGVPAAVTVVGQLTDSAMLPLPPGRESEPCLTEKGSTWTLDACSFAW